MVISSVVVDVVGPEVVEVTIGGKLMEVLVVVSIPGVVSIGGCIKTPLTKKIIKITKIFFIIFIA